MANRNKTDFSKLAEIIVSNVGGKENINGLRHCITRIRFRLKDEQKAQDDILKKIEFLTAAGNTTLSR